MECFRAAAPGVDAHHVKGTQVIALPVSFGEEFAELVAERSASPAAVWRSAEARLAQDPKLGFNTVVEACDKWADDPERVAVIVRHADGASERWTYAEMKRTSAQLATALASTGVQGGDRVAALLPQGIEAYLTALAAWRLGAVFIPLYPGFGSEGLVQRLRHGAPKVVVTDVDSWGALDQALQQVSSKPGLISVQRGTEVLPDGAADFWALVDGHAAMEAVAATSAFDTATLLYTSGTTDLPKGCLLPHSYLLTMQPFVRHTYVLRAGDVFASTSSPGWVNGLYSTGFCVSAEGIPRVIYTGRFDARIWLRILEEEKVTYFSSAPSALREILPACEEAGFPRHLRGGASAGESQGAELSRMWAEHCESPLQETYGTTEIGLVMATPGYPVEPREFGALPEVLPGFEVCLVDNKGEPTDAELGMLAVRNPGYQGCTGYLEDEGRWAERWSGDWYLTGDLARRDEQGQLWFRGRDDDLIVTSGYNVGPAEVESILVKHPMVRDAAVVAAPDARRGSVVRAVVIREPGETPIDDEALALGLKELVRERLGRHAYPRIVDFVDSLPRNAAGKVQRRFLRD